MRSVISLVAAAVLLAGCSGAPKPIGGAPGLQVAAAGELPEPTSTDSSGVGESYVIGGLDLLTINVLGIRELENLSVQVDTGGRFNLPMVGVVEAGGRSLAEVNDLIVQRLRASYVRNPRVAVNLKESRSKLITIDGQVRDPGVYPVVADLSLLRAVALAKGTTENAKLNDVVIFRTVNGQRLAALYNLAAIRRGTYGDPRLFANDIVVVGDSPARRLFRDALQLLPVITTPLVLTLQNNN